MKKIELEARVAKVKGDTHDALQAVVDELNKGQTQKLVKNPKIKALFDRYGVDYTK